MARTPKKRRKVLRCQTCQLGNLDYSTDAHFCPDRAVAIVAGTRLCAKHLRLVEEIAADAARAVEVAA